MKKGETDGRLSASLEILVADSAAAVLRAQQKELKRLIALEAEATYEARRSPVGACAVTSGTACARYWNGSDTDVQHFGPRLVTPFWIGSIPVNGSSGGR